MTDDAPEMPEVLLQYAAGALRDVQTWLLVERGVANDDDALASIIQQRALNAVQWGYKAGLAAKGGTENQNERHTEELNRQYKAGRAAEREHIRKLLAEPSDELLLIVELNEHMELEPLKILRALASHLTAGDET